MLEGNPKVASDRNLSAAGEAKNPAISATGIIASPLAAAVVTAISRCELCAAKFETRCA